MVADPRISPVAGLDSSLIQVRRRTLAQGWIQRLTSIWALGIAFVTAFVIAAGPFQQTDLLLAMRWLRRIEPDLVWFAHPADSSEPTSASSSTVGVSVVPPPSVSSSMASEPADGASDRIASVPPIRMPAAASRTRIERTRRAGPGTHRAAAASHNPDSRASARRPSGPLRTAATAPRASRRPGPGSIRRPAAGRSARRARRSPRR